MADLEKFREERIVCADCLSALGDSYSHGQAGPEEIMWTNQPTCKIESCLDPEEYHCSEEKAILDAKSDLKQGS